MEKSLSISLEFFLIRPLIVVFFILITIFPLSCCEVDVNFMTCGRRYERGNIKNLSFPFWGDDRPEFCGHEGFRLRCENREYPVINISGIQYGVLHVSQENYTMTLVRSDLWDTPSNTNGLNTTLNHTLFVGYPATVENLTLIYGCRESDPLGGSFHLLNNFSCSKEPDGNDRISYFVRESLLWTLNDADVQSGCCGVVQVPVFRTVLDEMDRSAKRGVQEVTDVLREGFDVQYVDFQLCIACEKARGRCVNDITT
ncbi:hypothetical protein TIFTF001_025885 [Ficus carica]|uniref:non-specific serine/threonine protein kinase n=1 Tax=Ficus carica TaxID=3494 RepID=A0AA88B1P0_FICCA|nr:hypothetical protein TIFTF001_025885 [Ficus carica]